MLDTATPIDPLLTTGGTQPHGQYVTLPTRSLDDQEGDDEDGDGNEGNAAKRQKLNLWKCRQCRDARKKCFPADRVWPQKCDRCMQHRPEPLDCSEPELNTRKRGKNQPKETKEKEKEKRRDKIKDKDPSQQIRRSKTASTTASDRQEPRSRGSTDDEDGDSSAEDNAKFERPQRSMGLKGALGLKREYPGSPTPEPPKPRINKEDHPASCYLPLHAGEFRILQLYPPVSKDDKNIKCSFITASVNNLPEYEAISYLWGAPNQKSVEIQIVDPHGKPHSIYIRSNVYNALLSLRHPQRSRSFWVDALCINYSSPEKAERNSQTAMKRYVFRNAVNLCFWLGEDDSEKKALKFIKTWDLVGSPDHVPIDKLVRDESTIEDWSAFVKLLKNTIFTRLWLVQEVAVAQNVTLHSGQTSIHYEDFVDAVSMFLAKKSEITLLFRNKQMNYKELYDRKVMMAVRFIEVSTNALRLTSSGKTERLLSLESLVSHLNDFSASDPLDRIYSVLAIAKDGPTLDETTLIPFHKEGDKALMIDYNKKIVEVYQDFVIRAIELSHSLDIICRYWAGPDERLPTWVRPLQLLQPAFDSNISERTEADSLVGLPDHNPYHASRGKYASIAVHEADSSGTRLLTVEGFLIDTIAKLGPRASEGIILYEWLELGGCVKMADDMPEEFWRTLVADRGLNGANPPSWYTRAFHYCLQHLTPTGDINTNRLIDQCEAESSLVVEFLRRVQSVIWNRKFLVSKQNKWIGLAPMAALEEDVICVLHGCSVPVILRPTTGGTAFRLVGECYVHGLMEGEAMELPHDVVDLVIW